MTTQIIKTIDYEALHQGSEKLAISNSLVNRFLARLALYTTAKLFKRDGPCVRLTRDKLLKTGFDVHLTEAATMNWTEESRGKIFSQLKDMIQELRNQKPLPGTGIESCVGGSLYDTGLPHGTPRFGPFKSTLEFHHWLRRGLEPSQIGPHISEDDARDLKAMIARQDKLGWGPPVFTHCDLNPTSIIVRGDQIVGIVDWEFAGWYPAYWEYACAWFGNMIRTEWQSILLSLLDPYPEDLEMDRTRCKWVGEW